MNEVVQALVQFGVAGLMGVLWVWERGNSRQRERQLTEAHQRIVCQERCVETLGRMVQRNTQALVEFERTQRQIVGVLEGIKHELGKVQSAA